MGLYPYRLFCCCLPQQRGYIPSNERKLAAKFLHLRMVLKAGFVWLAILSVQLAAAQPIDSLRVSVTTELPLAAYLEQIERETGNRFYFRPEWLETVKLTRDQHGKLFRLVLHEMLSPAGFSFHALSAHQLVFIKDPRPERERAIALQEAWVQQRNIREIKIGLEDRGNAGPGPFQVKGRVKDQRTDTPVNGLSVTTLATSTTTLTDGQGVFTLQLPVGRSILLIDHVNYSPQLLDVEIYQNGTLELQLEEKPRVLAEVVISDQAIQDRTQGESRLRTLDIKRSTTFLGEADLIKQIQTQPGVAVVGEIATGFHVRGGSVDQNLVLYDGIPIYNASHALGFFGTFLADGIRETTFYPDWQPAEMGGRISSVLSLTPQDGDRHRWHGSAGIGPISAYASLHGPLAKKVSLFTTFRSTYSNWALRALQSRFVNLVNTSVKFHDGSARLTYWLSDKTTMTASYYRSSDAFRLTNDTTYGWQNQLGSVRLTHQFNPRLAAVFNAGLTTYQYQLRDDERFEAYRLRYDITQPSIKADFIYEGAHELKFGVQSTLYQVLPGTFTPEGNNVRAPLRIPRETAHETSVYVADRFRWKKWELQAAGRFVFYQRLGPASVSEYVPDGPKDIATRIGTTSFESGKAIQTYPAFEPRIQLRYIHSDRLAWHGSAQQLNQFIHLVTNSAVPNPVDVWQLSNSFFRPQRATVVSMGVQWFHASRAWSASANTFGKNIENALDFKDGSLLLLNPNLETALLPGLLRAGGAEARLSKLTGRLTGQVNYTFSRVFRKTPGASRQESVNRGNWYPAHFDLPHLVQVQWRYGISTRHFFTGTFLYHTGRPISMPSAYYIIEGIPITQFEERNTYRLRDYHRLDLAFVIEGNYRRKKPWSGTWTVSFFNVYARKNPFSAFFVANEFGQLLPQELALVGTIIPSINYSLKF